MTFDGRGALAAFLRAHGDLHDAGPAKLRVDEAAGRVSPLLRDVWGGALDARARKEAEMAVEGASPAGSGASRREAFEGSEVIHADLAEDGFHLGTSAGAVRIDLHVVSLRTAPVGS